MLCMLMPRVETVSYTHLDVYKRQARAMEMRWRSPPESLAPFSPMGVP